MGRELPTSESTHGSRSGPITPPQILLLGFAVRSTFEFGLPAALFLVCAAGPPLFYGSLVGEQGPEDPRWSLLDFNPWPHFRLGID